MSDKSRMHLSEEEVVNNDDVGESSVIVLSEGTIDVPVLDWDTALKMNCPLPSLPLPQIPADLPQLPLPQLPPLPPLPQIPLPQLLPFPPLPQIPADLPPLPPLPQIPADLPQLLPLPPLPQIHADLSQLPPLPPLPQIPLPQLPPLPLLPQFPLPDLHHHQNQKTITPPAKSKVCLTLDAAIEKELKRDRKLDPNMDTKTLRRMVSNRLAAQRSRMRRSGYIHDLEMKIKDLEEYVKNMKAQAEFYNENRRLIQEENNSLRRAIDIRANEAKIGQNYMEELQRLIISLKENLANEGKSFTNPLTIRTEEMEMRMMMQESVTISTKPYSIEFYEQRLKKMEMNQDHHNDHQLLIHAARSESEADESFTGLINFDDVDEEGEGVDQYLNLDEMLNLDPN